MIIKLPGCRASDAIDDDAPLFDIRLANGMRRMGWGEKTVRELVRHLFDTYPRITRIEAQTRDDNIAMRRVLLHNGFVKEAHYRRTWPVAGGSPRDSVAYGLLRSDFETGRTTPLVWDDLRV